MAFLQSSELARRSSALALLILMASESGNALALDESILITGNHEDGALRLDVHQMGTSLNETMIEKMPVSSSVRKDLDLLKNTKQP